MAKKQTRRSISVSRSTYERLRAYCETTGMSMSQFVETRVGDFLGRSRSSEAAAPPPSAPAAGESPREVPREAPREVAREVRPQPVAAPRPAPTPAKPATQPTADQIFTF
jgi:hypothetical protein